MAAQAATRSNSHGYAEETPIPTPSAWLALTEAHRAMAEVLTLRLCRRALERSPNGDGHPVVVLPGFMGGDGYNAALRRFLSRRKYHAYGWGQGRNLGPRDGVLEALQEHIHGISERHQRPVSLVGHSLGGVFARELARAFPERIRQVISLGSPFGEGRISGSIPARLFIALNPVEELPIEQDQLHHAPPVPTTAIYSRGDGIVNWQTTLQINGHEHTQSVRVRGSHCGMTLNPAIWYLVAERLAQAEGEWQPFQIESWMRLLYPTVHD